MVASEWIERQRHIFSSRFSRQKRRGTGLGLATSYGIVRQSGGAIQIESELGKGTTVRFFCPRSQRRRAPIGNETDACPTGTETILVLEDDVSVRHISVRVLRGLGYDVIEAATIDDAQRVFTRIERS